MEGYLKYARILMQGNTWINQEKRRGFLVMFDKGRQKRKNSRKEMQRDAKKAKKKPKRYCEPKASTTDPWDAWDRR